MTRISGPMIGNYATEYEVDVQPNGGAGACYDVSAFTDGEFPLGEGNPGEPVRFHLCSAEQVVDFGLTLIELAQVAHPGFVPSAAWATEVRLRLANIEADRRDQP